MTERINRPRPKHRTRRGPRPLDFGPLLYTVLGFALALGGDVALHLAGMS